MKLLATTLSLTMLSAFAAAPNETKGKIETVAPDRTDKVDKLITNRRFRASNGSLSKFSVNASLSYNGGSIEKPFAADRPNIANAGDTTSISGLSGTINTTYRITKLNRINFGAGIQMLAPFNGSIDTDDPRAKREFDRNQGELDIANPSLSYTHMNKFLGVQTILTGGMTKYTADNLTDVGYDNSIDVSVNTMYDFGGSNFSAGALLVGNRYFFDKDDTEFLASQNETVFGFLPQAEYIINDTYNLRTIIRSNWYQNNRAQRSSKYQTRPVTQSIGLGISVNRDVFLYPNLQFPYDNLKLANTNVGFSANINMF